MVLQVPGERVIFASSLIHSGLAMSRHVVVPEFLVCVPAPTLWPR